MKEEAQLVYSSEHGRMCPGCGQPVAACVCPGSKTSGSGDGIVRVRRESKGRGGKKVTVVTGLPLAGEALKSLAKDLKRRCGTGGTAKEGNVEIQGDHADLLVDELRKQGYVVKRSGG